MASSGVAPSLHGVGAHRPPTSTSALGGCRSPPLDTEPIAHAAPRTTEHRSRRSIAYIGSLGGPSSPRVDLANGSLARGQQLFTETLRRAATRSRPAAGS